MPMLYAGEPGSPPIGTRLYDARGQLLASVIAFDPHTGEVIDWRPCHWLRWLHPAWRLRSSFWQWMAIRGVSAYAPVPQRHRFVPAPIRVVLPDPRP